MKRHTLLAAGLVMLALVTFLRWPPATPVPGATAPGAATGGPGLLPGMSAIIPWAPADGPDNGALPGSPNPAPGTPDATPGLPDPAPGTPDATPRPPQPARWAPGAADPAAPALELPPLDRQELAGDSGVREGMTVTLPPGPKEFRLLFRTQVADRSGAEAALQAQCPPCQLSFAWSGDRELLVRVPEDPRPWLAPYTVGRITVSVAEKRQFLWAWALASGERRQVAEITGLYAQGVSPDGRYAFLVRFPDIHSQIVWPPVYYALDLESGARLRLGDPANPGAGPRVSVPDFGALNPGGLPADTTRVYFQPGPGGRWLGWRARAPGEWDLVVQRPGAPRQAIPLPAAEQAARPADFPRWDLYWAPNGERILAVPWEPVPVSAAFLLDTETGRLERLALRPEFPTVSQWLWLPDNRHFAAVGDTGTVVFDLQGRQVATLPGRAHSWSPGGGYILYDLGVTDAGGRPLVTLEGVRGIGWMAEGRLLVAGEE